MPTWLEITFGAVGTAGAIFGIYQYYASRTVPKLTFEVRELSDFGLPPDFYNAVALVPVSFNIFSAGNKAAENIIVHLKSRSLMRKVEVATDVEWKSDIANNLNNGIRELTVSIGKLNPNDAFNLLVYCDKLNPPSQSIIQEAKVTIAEGKVLDKKVLSSKVSFAEALNIILDTSIPHGISGNVFRAMTKILTKF